MISVIYGGDDKSIFMWEMKNRGILVLLFLLCVPVGTAAQETRETREKPLNFGFAKNPSSRVKKQTADSDTAGVSSERVEQISANKNPFGDAGSTTAAAKTLEVARRAAAAKLPPTEIYRVGAGDVLYIGLQNAPAKTSTYYTVLSDGMIDYPLAGGMVSVAGLTVEEIEELLSGKISLYENPQVAVRVREYASHAITVLGLAEKTGENYLRREAVPLFVVKAEAVVRPEADQAVIRRAGADFETVDLKDARADEILILPGDIVEFRESAAASASNKSGFFYIGGGIISAGQKDYYPGMTLTQAILAAGGLKKSSAKRVVVRRRNAEGLLESKEFNLREIKAGKIPDPTLEAGDTIEIDD